MKVIHSFFKLKNCLLAVVLSILGTTTIFAQSPSFQTLNRNTYIFSAGDWYLYDTSGSMTLVDNGVVTIKYAATATATDITSFEHENNLELIRDNKHGYYHYHLRSTESDMFTQANALNASALVGHINVNLLTPVDQNGTTPLYAPDGGNLVQWHLPWIDIGSAWAITHGSPNVTVAVIDCGCVLDHPDLDDAIYENNPTPNHPGEDAWSNPQVPGGNGTDDDGNGYTDDWKGWYFGSSDNATTSQNNDVRSTFYHGIEVTGVIAERTNNGIGFDGVAGGDGPNPGCNVLELRACEGNPVDNTESWNYLGIGDAIYYAVDKGVKIISTSIKLNGFANNDDLAYINDAIKFAYNHGVLITGATGDDGSNDGSQAPVVYPASSQYVMAVGGIGFQSYYRWSGSNYGPEVSVSAPAKDIVTTADDPSGTIDDIFYEAPTGTSFSSPMVAGIAALMLSVNPCLGAEDLKGIIEQTAEKNIDNSYNANWNPEKPGHSQELGYGCINAYHAVLGAQSAHSSTLDLFIKDTYADLGYRQYSDPPLNTDEIIISNNESPDIWVRNHNDGLENWQPENPIFSSNQVYVYVRVHNKSCVTSQGNEKLSVYWSLASSWASWPQNWDGSNTAIGNKIITTTIPVLQPGEQTIIEIPWTISDVGVGNYHPCILARIEDVPDDPIATVPDRLDLDIINNNNIAIKNLTVVTGGPGKPHTQIGDLLYPNGGYVLVGNPLSSSGNYNLHFFSPKGIPDITHQAELKVYFDDAGWSIFNGSGQLNQPGIRVLREKEIVITSPDVSFTNLAFPAGLRVPLYLGFSFYSDTITKDTSFYYQVTQSFPETPNVPLGTENYAIYKKLRDPFKANAGPDKYVTKNTPISIVAAAIPEDADYTWYDNAGNIICTGQELTVCDSTTTSYRLEVVSKTDGFKDYDDVTVHILRGKLVAFSPNPTSNTGILNYELANVGSAYIKVVQAFSSSSVNVGLDVNATSVTIDLSQFNTGIYTLVLVCDGTVTDAINVQKQ